MTESDPAATTVAPPSEAKAEDRRSADTGKLDSRQRWMLLVAMVGTFIAIMDSFIVNVAVPSIREDLNASFAQAELTISGYVLVYGLLLITGGRLGDIHGYKKLFLVGVGLFTLASLLCGIAPTPATLIGFRVLQAVGAALFYPQVLSILQTAFTGKAQARAFALFGVTIGLASIAGQLFGGLLTSWDVFGLSWRLIFLVNIPIGLLTMIGAARTLPTLRGTQRPTLDMRGVLLLSVALLLLSIPLVEGQNAGWPPWILGMLLLFVPAFIAFTFWERRLAVQGGDPLVNPVLFRRPTFAGGNTLALAFFAGNTGLFFILTLQLQEGLGYSPLAAGLTFTPLAVTFVAASLVAPRLQPRLGMHVLTLGYGINAAGTLALLMTAFVTGTEMNAWVLVPALAVIGFGEGLGVSPLFGAVLNRIPEKESGSASGVLETMTQFGNSFGVMILGLVFFAVVGTGGTVADYSGAFIAGLVVNLALALLTLLLLPLLLRKPKFEDA
ncbi:MFS transporter [Salinactinospora qingdaonensis]|uniref:MFS transporter n=1 Tax=Salinactinospora qingdaonensis TaxID=702744 RepID=A0ABP7G6P9_9ACTN